MRNSAEHAVSPQASSMICRAVLSAAVALGGSSATAGQSIWTTGGPPDDVAGIAADTVTSALYAAGTHGVYKSLDRGTTWANTSVGANTASPTAVAVGPTGLVYAGTIAGGLSVSANGGASWTTLLSDNPLASALSVSFIATDPIDPATLYIKGSGFLIAGPTGALLRTRDGGAHFSTLDTTPVPAAEIRSLSIDPKAPSTIYVGAGSWGVLKSLDRGDRFLSVGNPGDTESVQVVFVEPPPSSRLLAGSDSGLFQSADGGTTFGRIDLGRSPVAVRDIKAVSERPGQLFLATGDNGVLATSSGGLAWYPLNPGLPSTSVSRLAVGRAGTSLHAVGGWTGVYDLPLSTNPWVLKLIATHSFSVQLSATDQRTGTAALGLAIPQNDIFGYFSLPELTGNPANPEVFVKILDGTSVNGKFWVFYGGLTDLAYTLTVTEDSTGKRKSYAKPAGSAAGGFDTSAFP